MNTLFPLHDPTPSPEEVRALVRRAHRERSAAVRRILGGLFFADKAGEAELQQARNLKTAACG